MQESSLARGGKRPLTDDDATWWCYAGSVKTLRPLLISSLFWAYVVLSSLVLFLLALLVFALSVAFDRRRRLLHLFTSAWAYHYVMLMPLWKVSFQGRSHIDPGSTYVLVANHQSLLDIPVLFGLFRPFKWVSKQEVFRVPIIGWNMALAGYVSLRRGRKGSITRMMRDCRAQLGRGSSILIFPEGTRSPDGRMRKFRQGAFTLAQDAGVRVVPIAVHGTHESLPKKGAIFRQSRPVEITVRVLEPVAPDAAAEAEELTRMVEEMIGRELEAMRKRRWGEEQPEEPSVEKS